MHLFTITHELTVSQGVYIETITLPGGNTFTGACLGESGRGRNMLYVPFTGKKNNYSLIKEGNVYFNQHGYPRIRLDQSPESSRDEALVFFYAPIGFRGNNKLILHYGVDILGTGTIADGMAGRMACGEQWLLRLYPEAQCRFIRTGRLYGAPSEYVITYKDAALTVVPTEISAMLDD